MPYETIRLLKQKQQKNIWIFIDVHYKNMLVANKSNKKIQFHDFAFVSTECTSLFISIIYCESIEFQCRTQLLRKLHMLVVLLLWWKQVENATGNLSVRNVLAMSWWKKRLIESVNFCEFFWTWSIWFFFSFTEIFTFLRNLENNIQIKSVHAQTNFPIIRSNLVNVI